MEPGGRGQREQGPGGEGKIQPDRLGLVYILHISCLANLCMNRLAVALGRGVNTGSLILTLL